MIDLQGLADLFATRRPGYALPQALYNSDDAFAFDMEAIFRPSWLMVGFDVELPNPGSWMATTVGSWPILLTRDRGGDLHGFHNSCRHRGSRLCAPGKGGSARIVCPYHRWTYELSGELVHASRMPDDFVTADHPLAPIHVRNVGGVICVCLAQAAPPLEDFEAAMAPLLAPHRLSHAKLAFESTLVEKANWKLVMENARECYHCAVAHPELANSFPVTATAHFNYGDDSRQEVFLARLAALGLPGGPVEGDGWQAVRFILNEGFTSMTVDGRHAVKRLMCETGGGDIGSLRWAMEPNSFAHATADHVFMFSAMPVGPRETVVTSKWLVHAEAKEGVDYDVQDIIRLWTQTNMQDRGLVETNQLGVDSLGYSPGPYSPEAESLTMGFTDWYCRKAGDYLQARLGARLRTPSGEDA